MLTLWHSLVKPEISEVIKNQNCCFTLINHELPRWTSVSSGFREISQDSGGLLLDISGYSMYSIMIVIFYKMLLGKMPPISLHFLQLFSRNKHNNKALVFLLGFPAGTSGREPACQCKRHERCKFDPWIQKIPWSRAWQLTPIFLPGESNGHRSLAGYSP